MHDEFGRRDKEFAAGSGFLDGHSYAEPAAGGRDKGAVRFYGFARDTPLDPRYDRRETLILLEPPRTVTINGTNSWGTSKFVARYARLDLVAEAIVAACGSDAATLVLFGIRE